MGTRFFEPGQVDVAPLRGRAVAVIGYGNQGRAHALNLRDSAVQVRVGQRTGAGFERARSDGFEPLAIGAAVRGAALVILTLPDEVAAEIHRRDVAPALAPGQALGFAHGFNIHYGLIRPPEAVDVIMVAPKGTGAMVREAFRRGSGLPCLVAVHHDASGQAQALALAWAAGLGAGRSVVLESSFAAETETDLFGEQAAVVGGVTAVMKTAFQTLVEAGYEPEHAYLECVHEVKFVVDLIHAHGLSGMRERISDTAEYGDLSRGPRLAEALAPVFRGLLEDIRSGRFAREWVEEHEQGRPRLRALFEEDRRGLLECTGSRLRAAAGGQQES